MIGTPEINYLMKKIDAQKAFASVNYSFYLKSEPDKNNFCPIYLSVTVAGKRKRIPVELKILPENWDKEKKQVINCPEAKDYNLIIGSIKSKINAIQVKFRLSEKPLTMEAFIDNLKGSTNTVEFIKFFEHYSKNLDISHSTLKKHKSIFEKLRNYSPYITFPDIDPAFFEKYRKYLKSIGNNQPTINTNISVIKRYLRLAEDYGLKIYVDCDKIKTGTTGGRIIFLTLEEIKKIEEYYYSSYIPQHYKITLGYFLFAYYAGGMRISDVFSFKRKDLDVEMLEYNSFKTNFLHKIMISEKCRKIIDHTPELFNDFKSEQKINFQLKSIASFLGIKKRLFFHVARHSFATNYLESGGKIENLQVILGHTSIVTTMKYVHVLKENAALTVNLI